MNLKAGELIPPRAYRMGIDPPVMKSGKGVLIKDEDGNECGFVLAWGPMILGHCEQKW